MPNRQALISSEPVTARSARRRVADGRSWRTLETAAQHEAAAWLGCVDLARDAESWQRSSCVFRASKTPDQWRAERLAARTPIGALVSREPVAVEREDGLPGAPAGQYVVVHYLSSFEREPMARETVALRREPDGAWRVAAYFVL